jgi:hypothetical protein
VGRVKYVLLGILLHIALREAASYSVGVRFRNCRRVERHEHHVGPTECVWTLAYTPWEQMVLLEWDLGKEVMFDK